MAKLNRVRYSRARTAKALPWCLCKKQHLEATMEKDAIYLYISLI